jgi:RNA polymerase sigma-70 factor (ECF subfamily)
VQTEIGDAELILRSSREPELFGVLFERHAEAMLAFFVRRTLDAEAAAELVAETFAEGFSSRRRFREQGVEGVAWLYGIGRHLLSRYFRTGAVEARARRRLGMPERDVSVDDYDRIEELIDIEDAAGDARDALGELPEDQRDAVRLRVLEGRPYREVAETLGCTDVAARARVSRGLKAIARRLNAEAPIELERQRWKRRSTT